MNTKAIRCSGKNSKGNQCSNNVVPGFNLCWTHGWHRTYYIGFTWQEYPGQHWTQKKKAIWPILFKSREEAHLYMSARPQLFKNMGNKRKLTACVEQSRTRIPNKDLVPNIHYPLGGF